MAEEKKKSADPAVLQLLAKCESCEGLPTTMWDRYDAMQPQCRFGELGVCCTLCFQGPCRINPTGKEPVRGICGATDYTIVSRNLLRRIAAGTAAHSDHGRHIAHTLHALIEGETDAYSIKSEDKLKAVAKKVGITAEGKDTMQLAKEVVDLALEDFARQDENVPLTWLKTILTPERMEILERCDVVPYNIDAMVTETMHRTTMGVDADPVPLIFNGVKCAMADLAGEAISTDLSDILFGVPKMVVTQTNLGVLKEDQINLAMHGHNPVLSEVIADMADEMVDEAKAVGATGINLVGVCCTGNELLSRRGIPLATNFASQEAVLMTGAVDAMIVDYQCVMPSLGMWAQCYHTQLISTSNLCRQAGDVHIEFNPKTAKEDAKRIIGLAIEAYKNRKETDIEIPDYRETIVVGFSLEQIEEILRTQSDDPYQYIVDQLKEGKIKGFAAMAGCNNLKTCQDESHLTLAREFLKNDIMVLATGCAAGALVRGGFTSSKATQEMASEGLKEFLTTLGKGMGLEDALPPVWHMGSCVDNSRIQFFMTTLANKMGVDIKDLPIVASAPEDMSEKATAIGTWLVASGWPVHVGIFPFIHGSPLVVQVAELTARDVYGGFFIFETDPNEAARRLSNIIKHRRWKLGIDADEEIVYPTGETAADFFEETEPQKANTANGGK
ncbi:MAG: anaerobic carbon-monoxide dehydrogenase catalytic subunit [Methanobacteriota archaeon]|nr:MAG: anaerobic carbon-monoxide dehydrogenase catalytic subunit [Euryarchaeota archaeon]